MQLSSMKIVNNFACLQTTASNTMSNVGSIPCHILSTRIPCADASQAEFWRRTPMSARSGAKTVVACLQALLFSWQLLLLCP